MAPLQSIHLEVAALGWPCHQPDQGKHCKEALRLPWNVLLNIVEPSFPMLSLRQYSISARFYVTFYNFRAKLNPYQSCKEMWFRIEVKQVNPAQHGWFQGKENNMNSIKIGKMCSNVKDKKRSMGKSGLFRWAKLPYIKPPAEEHQIAD